APSQPIRAIHVMRRAPGARQPRRERRVRKSGQHRRDHRADEREPNRVAEVRRGDADRPVDTCADHVADAEDDEAGKSDAPGERGLAPIRRAGGAPRARIAHAEFSVAAAPRSRRHYSLATGTMSTRGATFERLDMPR